MTSTQVYNWKNDYLSMYYPELSASEFYREIFPLDTLENKGDTSHRASNPIFSYKERNGERVFFRNEIVFADHFEESLQKTVKNDLALCSMVSYSGRRKSAKNAFKCHGFCIDLDGVGQREMECFFGHIEHTHRIPNPTYVVNSGHGIHVYYLFENPVPLYPSVVQHLQNLKRGLTREVWNQETSSYKVKDRQFQGIYQSFRMVGSRTKLGKGNARNRYLVRAFKTGMPTTITELNRYVDPPYRVPDNMDYSSWDWADEGHYCLSECQELFPEWYERRIVRGEPSGQWKCSRGLYDWWLGKIQEGAKDGNRFHCISMLYVYGVKCMIPKEIIDADAEALLDPFNELTMHEDNDFTLEDIRAASKFYDSKYSRFSRKEVERRTGIRIDPTRRNGRPREEHLKYMNFARDMLKYPNGDWRNKDGRPDKKAIVQDWKKAHPDGKKADCVRDTGLDKKTVYKWWEA